MTADVEYEVYETRTAVYGKGNVSYTLTRRIIDGDTVFGMIIEENICEKTLRAEADDISRDPDEALEMLEMFYKERLDACHLEDVLEEILPFAVFKREREGQTADNYI